MADYSVEQLTPTGQLVRLLDRVVRIKYQLTANNFGVAQIDVPADFDLSSIQEDSRLNIWRRVRGGKKYKDGDAIWLIRDWDYTLNDRGQAVKTVLAYSGLEIIDRAIVAYASETSQAEKSDFVDDMLKALARENFGALATDTARDLSNYIAVAANAGAGPTVSKAFAWRQLLPTMQELAQEADEQGTRVFFDVVEDVSYAAGLVFKTYIGQRGVDHTGAGSAGRVVLSPKNGTLSAITQSYQSSAERNYIYAGGKGIESERAIEEAGDADRIALSPFNRREYFINASNVSDANLPAEAGAALRRFRPLQRYSARVRDTEAVKFGREYGFGSRVLVDFGGEYVPCRLDSVRITVERGKERIEPELRVDP